MKKLTTSLALLAGASVAALATAAFAQSAPSQETETATVDEILVTGSRVIKNGDASPSPVTVISAETLTRANPGSTLADALNTLPTFAGSRGATSNPTTTGTAAGGNGAANQLNLRNLDAVRTLILMDGKRVPPTLFNGVVDVDIIPQMLVERVDVVTGGVSAVYGSDAVAGVVNYVINKKFNGVRAETSYGVSEHGDGAKFNAAFAAGTALSDRLHVEGSYEFRKEDGIDRRSDRDWLNQWGVTGAGTTANPYVLQGNLRQSAFPFGGLITTGALANQVFETDAVLSPFQNGAATGTAGVQVGGDGGYWDSGLVARLKGHQIFGRIDYDIADDVRFYAQASGNLKQNINFAETNQLNGITLSRANAYLPAQYRALIPTTETTFRFSKLMGAAPRVSADADSKQWVFNTGLSGEANGFAWGVDYVHGSTKLTTALNNTINRQKLGAALDAVNDTSGKVVCNITLTNPGLADGCAPLNVFGPTASSAAALAYVTETIHYNALTKMDDISGQVSHSLFDLGAGPVNAAISAEWRKVSFKSTSDSTPAALVNCTGIRFNCTAGATRNEFVFGQTPNGVSQTVWEVASEFDAPLLRDKAFAHSLNVNGAARYTKYNTSGQYWTWKVGMAWVIADPMRVRLTRSRDIRAPTLFDLFSPVTSVTVRPTDFLTGLAPTVASIDQGNSSLKAEIADTLTGGLVWKATSNLSFTVDAYKITIKDAITQIQGQTQAIQQACYDSGGASPYCQLQVRPSGYTDKSAANAVTAWLTQRINLSQIKTKGIDFEANYSGSLFGRSMTARLLTAYQPELLYIQPNVPDLDQGGAGFGPGGLGATPSVRVTAFLRFKPTDRVTVDITERWRNAMKLGGDPTQVWVKNRVDAFATTGLNVSWLPDVEFADLEVYANVQNLFDANPPAGAYSGNGTRSGLRDGFAIGDDPRGRFYTAGLRMKF